MKAPCFIVLIFIFAACNDEDVVKINRSDLGVYAHFDIRAEEGSEMATCVARFFTDKTKRNTLVLEDPAKIEIDGQALSVDSSRFLGAYYELQKPVAEFEGTHTITFTNGNNKEFNEALSFNSLSLGTDVNESIRKTDLVLDLKGLEPGDLVRVVMMDTAFNSDGINLLETVNDGQLLIKKDQLQKLKTGPVVLEISRESERVLSSGVHGTLTTTYSLRRDLMLTE